MTEQLTAMLTNISTIVTSIFTWVGLACSEIVTQPLLLFSLGFFAIGEYEYSPA